jgi:hypothetical protein
LAVARTIEVRVVVHDRARDRTQFFDRLYRAMILDRTPPLDALCGNVTEQEVQNERRAFREYPFPPERDGEDKTPLHYAGLFFEHIYLNQTCGTGISRRNNRKCTAVPRSALAAAPCDESPEPLNAARRRVDKFPEFGTGGRPIKGLCI